MTESYLEIIIAPRKANSSSGMNQGLRRKDADGQEDEDAGTCWVGLYIHLMGNRWNQSGIRQAIEGEEQEG